MQTKEQSVQEQAGTSPPIKASRPPLFFCCLLPPAACLLILLLAANAEAQQNTQLSPNQVAAVEHLKKHLLEVTEVTQNFGLTRKGTSERRKLVESKLSNLDPILVGKHIIFSKEWLDYIDTGNPPVITRQQFEVWRDRIDRAYDCYTDLIGRKAVAKGIIVFIDIRDGKKANAYVTIQFGRDDVIGYHLKDVAGGSWSLTMMHELAHMFQGGTHGTGDWNMDTESTACLLPAYILETIPEARYRIWDGTKYRKDQYERALRNFRENRIEALRGSHHENPGSVCELYLHGLVDVVGWETYKKTIQSYHNGTRVPTERFVPDKEQGQTWQHARAREFFDRLAYFHDEARASNDPQVLENIPAEGKSLTGVQALRSLPDGGELLDKYFSKNSVIGPTRFEEVVSLRFPGWTVSNSASNRNTGIQKIAGRENVLATIPATSIRSSTLSRTFTVPISSSNILRLVVTHHDRGSWNLTVKVDGVEIFKRSIAKALYTQRWKTIDIDLNRYAGKTIKLVLEQRPDVAPGYGYWSEISLTSTPITIPTSPPQPAKPTSPPEEEIHTVQAELSTLEEQYKALPKTRSNEAEAIRLSNQIHALKNRLNVLQAAL
jgi:hypothetical protein